MKSSDKPVVKLLIEEDTGLQVILVDGKERSISTMDLPLHIIMEKVEEWSGCSDNQEDRNKLLRTLLNEWAERIWTSN